MSECRIEDFALIGDCETAALVGRDGSIDWLCWPRFDSDACFAALLGHPENGRWRISPESDEMRTTRRYRPGTLILETRFETPDGAVLLTDFMPPRGVASDVVRIVTGEAGAVPLRMSLTLRFGYGRVVPWVTRMEDGALRAIAGPDMTVMRTPVEFRGENRSTVAEFTVRPGDTIPFVLSYGPSNLPVPDPIDPFAALADTQNFWSEWSARSTHAVSGGPVPDSWTEAISRSLITLKALTYGPTGGMVAAPTTSLPEKIGGPRNWDYRYCWLRDSSATLLAFLRSGYVEEATAWRDWLVRAMAGSIDQMQIMYGVAGERRLFEWEVEWLPGFAGSAPVRIGNGAHSQLQLDVYGEVMGLMHQSRLGGIPESREAWALQRTMLENLAERWREPDAGIWEVRSEPEHFTFSKVMAWLAFDSCIQSSEEFGLDESPLDQWRAIRDEIHDSVCRDGFDPEIGSFTRTYGSPDLDASLLLLPTLGFLPPDDPRITGTIRAIERDLVVEGLVLRYRTADVADGLPPGEGAFLACSFWLVGAYVMLGRVDEARELFDRLLALRNDVGLLAEEYDPRERRQLGNMPQAFSHLALVHAGHSLIGALTGKADAFTETIARRWPKRAP